MDDRNGAFLVFEGGGARGLAHVGALAAFEELTNSPKIEGVAGTSIGAVVAALVAAGYTAHEIYDPKNPNCLFNFSFTDFFPDEDMKMLAKFRHDTRRRFGKHINPLQLLLFALKYWKWLTLIQKRGGVLETRSFERWLNNRLRDKLLEKNRGFTPSGPDGSVSFQDLGGISLKVIVADVTGRGIRKYSKSDGNHSVASAVAASISIPFLFTPRSEFCAKQYRHLRLVDGGVVSNFPAWVFDEERQNSSLPKPTIGFRLTGLPKPPRPEPQDADGPLNEALIPDEPQFSLLQHLSDLFHTAVFGNTSLESRGVGAFTEVLLHTAKGALDFDATKEERDDLYESGKKCARDEFTKRINWRQPNAKVKPRLFVIDALLRRMMNLNRDVHLRLNISLPVSLTEIEIAYCLNMDTAEDTDDRLRFEKGKGVCGRCWESLLVTKCCLAAAANANHIWQVDKYQMKLVRSDLKCILCIPLLDSKRFNKRLAQLQKNRTTLTELEQFKLREEHFVGVLSVDSTVDLYSHFATLTDEVESAAPGDNKHRLWSYISDLLSEEILLK